MKKIIAILAVAVLAFTGTVNAQKFGHIDAQKILTAVPGFQASSDEMERYQKEKEKQYLDLQTMIQNNYQKYLAEKDALLPSIKASREKELQKEELKLQEFGTETQQRIQQKQQDLMAPLLKQIKDAIDIVAKENGFAYIFDITQQGSLVYFDGGIDVTDLVIAQIKKANAPTIGTGTTPTPTTPIMQNR